MSFPVVSRAGGETRGEPAVFIWCASLVWPSTLACSVSILSCGDWRFHVLRAKVKSSLGSVYRAREGNTGRAAEW